jgi:hypothetical protein
MTAVLGNVFAACVLLAATAFVAVNVVSYQMHQNAGMSFSQTP